jgi:hypothetical protein
VIPAKDGGSLLPSSVVVVTEVVVVVSAVVVVVVARKLVVDAGSVVVVAGRLVVVVGSVVVDAHAGQRSSIDCPTAAFKSTSASVAVIDPEPSMSQTHGAHDALPSALRSTFNASDASGISPLLSGLPQSAAIAAAG